MRPLVVLLTSALFWTAPAYADPETAIFIGAGYLLNDESRYAPDAGSTNYPDGLLHLRLDEGLHISFSLSPRWRVGGLMGFQIGVDGGTTTPDSSSRSNPPQDPVPEQKPGDFFLISVPLAVYAQYGTSPYCAVGAGYIVPVVHRTGSDDAHGFFQGVRFGWNDWYLSLDAIYQSGFTKSPTVKLGIGYEGFLHLLNQSLNPS